MDQRGVNIAVSSRIVAVELTGVDARPLATREPDGRRSAPTTGMTGTLDRVVLLCRRIGWRRLRMATYALWAGSVAWAIAVLGLPTDTPSLAEIIVSGLLIGAIGRGWRHAAQVLIDWLPFVAVLLLYDQTRAIAAGLGAPLHEADVLHAEKWLFGGIEPTVWLQQHLYDPHQVRWYDVVCTLVYTSHFLVTPILAAILWVRDRASWVRYSTRVIALSLAGLATYIAFPEAPPWLAARDGLTPPVVRLSPRGWEWLSSLDLNDALAHAQADGSNPVAAMPSLHTAFATLVVLTLIPRLRTKWRWLLVLYPLAMAFALVYTGEHYVIDLAAGVVYAVGVHLAVGRWEGWRACRASSGTPRAVSRVTVVTKGVNDSGGVSGVSGT